jgi:undecaprenyl-diphosphatase
MRRRQLTGRLKRLRELGAQATDTQEPQLEELYRVKASSILMAVGSLLAVAALLGQVGSPAQIWDTLKDAQWAWVVVAFGLSMASNLPFAVAYMGTISMRLPLWRTTELQTAVRFSNIAVPGVGGAMVQIRYLQKQGVSLAEAVAAGGLLSTVSFTVVQIGIFALALVLAPQAIHLGSIDPHDLVVLVLIVVLAVVAVAGLAFGIPKIRRVVVPPLERAGSTLWSAVRSPRQLLMLFGGNAVATVLSGFVFLACLEAFGAGASLWTLLAINIGVGTIASLVPVPGGSTAVGAVGMSGALIAVGLTKNVAVAAVLAQQLVYIFLPAVPGWLATRHLIDHDYL